MDETAKPKRTVRPNCIWFIARYIEIDESKPHRHTAEVVYRTSAVGYLFGGRTHVVVYRRLADLVLVLHVLIIWFLLSGPFLYLQDAWVALFHISLAVWVTAAIIMDWTCPLTPLENHLRKAAGEQGYEGGFVDHYLGALVPGSPSVKKSKSRTGDRKKRIILGVFVGVWTLAPHGGNVARYHDAIWPPPGKPPIASPEQ